MKNFARVALAALALAFGSAGWGQAVFNKYGPVNGIQKNTGSTYQNTAATSSDIISLFTSCSGTQYLGADGACHSVSGGVTSITAGSGLTGSPNPIVSTGTVLLDLTAANTWTGTQTFTPGAPNSTTFNSNTSNPGVIINGAQFISGLQVNGNTTSGRSQGIDVLAGTTSADYAIRVKNASSATQFWQIYGDGGQTVGSPTGGDKGLGTVNATGLYVNGTAVNALAIPVTVPNGGTGQTSLTNHGVLLGAGTSPLGSVAAMAADTLLQGQGASADPAAVSLVNCGSSTQALAYSTSTHTFSCQTLSTGASPGGSTNAAQYNAGSGTLGGVSLGADQALFGTASTPQATSVPNCGSSTQALAYSTGTHTFSCQTISAGGTPGGSNTQIQYNNSGAFGGAANFTFNSGTGGITITAPSSGVAFTVNGLANSNTFSIAAPNTASQSFGQTISAGTSTSDYAMRVLDATAATTYFRIRGDGILTGHGASAGGEVDMTPDTATGTGTLSGSCTSSPTTSMTFSKMGNVVTAFITGVTCTATTPAAGSFTITGGIPSGFRPARAAAVFMDLDDGGQGVCGQVGIATSGTLTFNRCDGANFQTSGLKGITQSFWFNYALN